MGSSLAPVQTFSVAASGEHKSLVLHPVLDPSFSKFTLACQTTSKTRDVYKEATLSLTRTHTL